MASEPADTLAQRRAVEAMIANEERVLAHVLELLSEGVLFGDWPAELRQLLCTALTENEDAVEAQKARVLLRHLFRSHAPDLTTQPQSELPPERQRLAERLRADLPGLTPLGAGLRCQRG